MSTTNEAKGGWDDVLRGFGMFSASQRSALQSGFLLTAWGLVVFACFLLLGSLIGDGSDEGQTELACAKAKLEEMWEVPLPADAEIVGSVPGSSEAFRRLEPKGVRRFRRDLSSSHPPTTRVIP